MRTRQCRVTSRNMANRWSQMQDKLLLDKVLLDTVLVDKQCNLKDINMEDQDKPIPSECVL
ncbi:hypothetical protein P3T76_009606 [Phytophthora citrophthora]|uniref:Uncharacterized protein n=1 Tax=Phytophthora citrophthora TaxID=4793 RepID=A0AAD9LJQ8_9STRA|nr:hypothetical protein P3T76_009606 [Phytophthora citrophthora]